MTNAPWQKWLKEHPSRDVYDKNPDKVTKLCAGVSSATARFEKLAKNKNLVVLSRAQIGNKLNTTFQHSVVGVPITPEDLHYVALSGLTHTSGIELDPNSFLKQTAAKHVPNTLDLMKLTKVEEVLDLKSKSTFQKRKINCFAILPPSMAETALKPNMSPQEALVAIVDFIKASATPPTVTPDASAADPTDTDDTLKSMGEPFEDTLRFLWASVHHQSSIEPPKFGNLQDEDSTTWFNTINASVQPAPSAPTMVDLTGGTSNTHKTHDGAVTAMTKLSESMIKHQEAVIRSQEEKSDPKLKAWNKLPAIQQNIILLEE